MVQPGKSTVIIGLQYGDEGKGRVLNVMLRNDDGSGDVVARFNGGSNAGHTVQIDDKVIVLHSIPSGVFYPGTMLYIGSGCVVNPEKVNREIKEINQAGINLEGRLYISPHASFVQPHHLILDRIYGRGIGTTGNGIGPAYADRALRALGSRLRNLRLGDYLSSPPQALLVVKENLKELAGDSRIAVRLNKTEIKQGVERFDKEAEKLSRYFTDDPLFLEKLVLSGKNVFCEGAQSTMLDNVVGAIPYVTSSRTLAAAAYLGDLSFKHHYQTIGVAKAIMSRVGNGPFVSEFGGKRSELYCDLKDKIDPHEAKYRAEVETQLYDPEELLKSDDLFVVGIALRMLGNEYGATTARPRRTGMLDLVMLRQSCILNGVDGLYINKFDCLADFRRTNLSGIPVVVGYRLNGADIDYVPASTEKCSQVEPVIEFWPHLIGDISKVRDYHQLPKEVKQIIASIEEKVGVDVLGIGVGPERSQFVQIREG